MKRTLFALASLTVIPHLLAYASLCVWGGKTSVNQDIDRWLERYNKSYARWIGLVYLLLKWPEFRSLFYHRIGKASFICKYLRGRTNLYIYTPSSLIGGGFYIGHGWGTVVNAERIGRNCMVGQNCTIGSKDLKCPTLEDNVKVWAHSIVLGDITIGEGSQIGAGAVVVKKVPKHCVVVPAKSMIIKENGSKVNIPL